MAHGVVPNIIYGPCFCLAYQAWEYTNTYDWLSVCRAERPFSDSVSEAETKAKKFYTACLDVSQTAETLGATPLLDLIHEQFPGWTVNWDLQHTPWDLQDTLEKIHALFISSLFSFWVGVDDEEPTKYILTVNYTPRSLYTDELYPLVIILYPQIVNIRSTH